MLYRSDLRSRHASLELDFSVDALGFLAGSLQYLHNVCELILDSKYVIRDVIHVGNLLSECYLKSGDGAYLAACLYHCPKLTFLSLEGLHGMP